MVATGLAIIAIRKPQKRQLIIPADCFAWVVGITGRKCPLFRLGHTEVGERDKPVSYCNISMCQIFPSVPELETSTHSIHIAQHSEFPPNIYSL